MPFDRNGIWGQPNETDHAAFTDQLMSKRTEIAPTPEMIQAIAANLPTETPSARPDVFNTIGKLKGPVDIVVPVYGGLHVLKPCLESIAKRTEWDYNLIIVDDCSPDPAVRKYLESVVKDKAHPSITVLYNRKNRGFAPTANRGVAEGSNPYVCILNSDTIVTKGWLVRQLMALEADERNVIVNPVTNNTALVNVSMYNGCSYIDMADAVAKAPNALTYNEIMPTGFCFTTRRSTWEEVGPFDEAYISYGEETDFWFKAIKQTDERGIILRNRGVIADNAYVFHERGTSFSQLGEGEHMGLRKSGSSRFNELHPDFGSWQNGFDAKGCVDHLRSKLPKEAFKKIYRGNIAFVVKSAGTCGGMNFIADIVNELIENGYNAKVCVVLESYDEEKPLNLQVVSNLRTAPILFKSHDEFTSTFTQRVFMNGKVFAAVTELTPLVWDIDQSYKGIEGLNFVQSYDVALATSTGREDLIPAFLESYKRLPNICASNWIAKELRNIGAAVPGVILPGVNMDLFHMRNREDGDERYTIAILINDIYPFKGKDWAFEFLDALKPEKRPDIRVLAIGPKALPGRRGVTCVGNLSQAKMAALLGSEVDVFVDPSEIHSYGMPGLEALVSGCRVITRENKGIHEYEEAWDTRVTVQDRPGRAANLALSWKEKKGVRRALLHKSVNRHETVKRFINFVFPPEPEVNKTRIEVVTPHLRKHGGPTTIISAAKQIQALGHNVELSTIYTDWNPEVLNMAKRINVRTAWEEVPEDVEVVIINSDNPFAEKLMTDFPNKKFIMYKLSHNARFKKTENDNLNLPWDHIMTSTEWLRGACINPVDDWDHKAWPEDKVTVVGWYHYGHEMFNMPPTNRTYGSGEAGFRLGTLVHDHPLKGTPEAMAVIDALKKKYEANFQAVGFGEMKARVPWHMQYIRSASRKDMAFVLKQLTVWFGASHTEGLGRLSLEAMSAGVAVVTTDTGAEFLKDRENCLLYPVGDAQRGGELVTELVEDEALFTKLVVGGHKTASEAASPIRFRNKLNQVINTVLAEKE
jgi:GT2 family glycosyltransferase/glycosyltransferase involved in cell wall biosynthesis